MAGVEGTLCGSCKIVWYSVKTTSDCGSQFLAEAGLGNDLEFVGQACTRCDMDPRA